MEMDDLEERVRNIEIEMSTHESQCEERWKTTFNRLMDIEDSLKRIENRIMVSAGSLIVFLAGVIVTLLMGHQVQRKPRLYQAYKVYEPIFDKEYLKDLADLLQMAHKMRMDEIKAQTELLKAETTNIRNQTNVQINDAALPFGQGNYGKLMEKLLSGNEA